MSNVISLAQRREENSPHWAGRCQCLGCGHEWTGVGPIGVTTDLECPSCKLPKGQTVCLMGADEGDQEFHCQCGCRALTAYKRKGLFHIMCMACGLDQTEALYG